MGSWGWRAAVAAMCVVAGCGGGGTGEKWAGIGSGGTGGIASGPITGFGSVIVNGVRFDDSAARVTIDGAADRPLSELKLGMVVEVRGDIDVSARTGRAEEIVARYAVRGPASDIDAAHATLVVLGQRVRTDAATVLDGLKSLAELAPGDLVAVSGLADAAGGALVATRLERRAAATDYEAQGTLGALSGRTFRLGSLVVDASNAALDGVVLAEGAVVSVRGALSPAGILVATRVAPAAATPPAGVFLEYVGYVSGYASLASFRVGTLQVNGSGARIEGGSAGQLANGLRIEVEGRVVDGVLVATEIDFLSAGAEAAAELEGAVTDFVSPASFRVRGQAVDASQATFVGGTAAQLGDGRIVHVIGMVSGVTIRASSVEFRDTMPASATRLAIDGVITDFASPASFRILGRPVSTDAATLFVGGSAADLANGRRIAAEGVVDAGGALLASSVTIYPREVAATVTASGRVAEFTSAASFTVNGQRVSAGAATVYVGGTAQALRSGVLVTVTGVVEAGVLQAARIEFRDEPGSQPQGEVEGYITDFVSPANFKVTGQRVDATNARYEHGTAATLANGLKVHCTGPVSGGILRATLVQIDR